MVPLHEAASRGHLDCIQIMIAMCVTPLSRTKLDETPADLARKNAFYQCARRLGNIFNTLQLIDNHRTVPYSLPFKSVLVQMKISIFVYYLFVGLFYI